MRRKAPTGQGESELAARTKRQQLKEAADFYLRSCYRTRTPARADTFAAYLGLARPYLHRRVRELTGGTPLDLLRARQLKYAKRLLLTTPLSVVEVGLASAFGSEWTFHRCFKAAFGLTPAQFRATARHRITRRE
jgi:AraC-like DNA-binding protein